MYPIPAPSLLIPRLSELAFEMQISSAGSDAGQVALPYDDACKKLDGERGEDILHAGRDLSILDEDIARDEVKYFHQLLQEFFAARRLAKEPNADLARVAWHVDEVRPTLAETLEKLADSDPLPPPPGTGWEETTVLAAAMAADPAAFTRGVMAANLPLAARCAASPEVTIPDALTAEIRAGLLARTRDPKADLRARIAAGEALGLLGHPEFERKTGPHGAYLMPPLVRIPAGEYPIGDDNAPYSQEKPAHSVPIRAFQVGKYPVTNAEYRLFMEAGGYEDERWWETDAAKAWLRGEGSAEGQMQDYLTMHTALQQMNEQQIANLPGMTSEQFQAMMQLKAIPRSALEAMLEEEYGGGKIYRQPGFWDDSRFNNPAQPVVGVTWFEARAYCAWLSAQVAGPPLPEGEGPGVRVFRLPTEVEREAAARGLKGRKYAYGREHDPALCNTFETHVRRTTPVGVFPGGAPPEGAADLTGNVFDWTSTIFDTDEYPYPYRAEDGREDPGAEGRRVLRGGSWFHDEVVARASFRSNVNPGGRDGDFGFRVVVGLPS